MWLESKGARIVTIILAVIGGIVILYYAIRILAFLIRNCFCRGRQNLLNLYGEGKRGVWAVVTGGSDGIGLAICHELAA